MSKIILILSLTFSVTFLTAAVPTWSVNPLNYQYNMNITGIANLSCEDLANSTNMIGAFINGECRGVVNTNVDVNGKKLAFLIVYSNSTLNNQTISFKIYNSSADIQYDVVDQLNFSSSSVIGNPTNPYIFRNNHAPSDILFPVTTIQENTAISSQIGIFSTSDEDVNDVHTYSLVSGKNSTHNSMFTISNNQLALGASLNINIEDTLRIRVKTLDQNGCSFEKEFNLLVINSLEAPTALLLSNLVFNENEINPKIGSFSAIDNDPNESFTYTLVNGLGDLDNASFSILGDNLFFNTSANFEVKNSYSIRSKVTDLGGLSFEKDFIITVIDLNEQPKINLQDYQVYELEPIGREIGLVTFVEYDNNQFQKFKVLSENETFSIDSLTGMLKLNKNLDYELKNEYIITVIIHDNGLPILTDTAFLKVNVIDQVELDVFPSADFVSPNDDGKNDYWTINHVEIYKDFSLKILDEFGQMVFNVPSNYNNEWDAKINGIALPNGNYYYHFYKDSSSQLFKGIITVLK